MSKELSVGLVGRGGQGILFATTILANALFNSGYYVAQLQSYGAEVRGGAVLAYVIYSTERIENPFTESFDSLVMLHDVKIEAWEKIIVSSRVVIADEDMVRGPPPHAVRLPLIKVAAERGLSGKENVVALGCLAGIGVVGLDALQKVIPRGRDSSGNLAALRLGYELWLERKAKQVP
ncbi:MAG: 2-oxoacid:acceptor oxidoreductase family protein [Desulfurococcales archaeon]|nr:2-oxoacid:acceptor oxidoreductase family protein [Desulfurococcales archaeon]